MHSCVRGVIPMHLLHKWWFQCIHVWGVGFRCIYLRDDDFGAFMCEAQDSSLFTWGVTMSVYSCVSRWRGRILVHLPEERQFRCIYVWGVRFQYNYLIDHECGAFMCVGQDSSAFTWGVMIWVHSCVKGKIPVHLLEGWWCQGIHVWGVGFQCIYLRNDDFGASMCEG